MQILGQDDMMGAKANVDTSGSGLDSAHAVGEAQSERRTDVVFEALVADDQKTTASASNAQPSPTPAQSPSSENDT